MDEFLKYLPLLVLPFSFVPLLYKAAEAKPEHNKQVGLWVVEIVLVLIAALIFVWFGYQCILFVTSTAELRRAEVALFALNMFNLLMYGNLLLNYLLQRLRRPAKREIARLEEIKAQLSDELLEERENRIKAEMRADNARQLAIFARELLDSVKK